MMSISPKHTPPDVLTAMPSYNRKAITIAISLLKRKSPQTIQTLKDLLTFIPNPNHIKDVLIAAVIELVHTCPQTAWWLFQYPEVLEPEIQARDIIIQELTEQFYAWGYTSDDFHFTDDQHLEISEATKDALLTCKPAPADVAPLTLIQALLPQ